MAVRDEPQALIDESRALIDALPAPAEEEPAVPPALFPGRGAHAERTLMDVLGETARRHPNAPAVDDGTAALSYRALLAEVERVRLRLVEAGLGVGDRVGIRVPSGTADLYVGILAVLAAGAAYVPVDAEDPDERAELVFSEATTDVSCWVRKRARRPRRRDRSCRGGGVSAGANASRGLLGLVCGNTPEARGRVLDLPRCASPDALVLSVSVHTGGTGRYHPFVQRFVMGGEERRRASLCQGATGDPAVIIRQDLDTIARTVAVSRRTEFHQRLGELLLAGEVCSHVMAVRSFARRHRAARIP